MLVKFLSFVASVLGTARYKAVFLSCLALVLSLAGITAMALHGSGQAKDTSSAVEQSKDGDSTRDTTPQLHGIKKQEPKPTPQTQPDSQSQPSANGQSADNTPNSTIKPSSTSAFSFELSKPSISLAAGNTSGQITVTTSDGSSVTWQVTVDNANIQIVNLNPETGTFQVQASNDAVANSKPVIVQVVAIDASRNINTSKQLSVTIQ